MGAETADLVSLADPELRGPRLELDYLSVELALRQHGVTGTIVVFGSSLTPDPEDARRRLADLEAAAVANPSRELKAELAAARKDVANSRYYAEARAFGRLVGGINPQSSAGLIIMTGGGPGIMEAANRGVRDVGGISAGLNIRLRHEQASNRFVSPGLLFEMRYFAIRKLHLLLRAKALVAFPGGFGTLDELFETLNLVKTRKIEPMPVVLVGRSFWNAAVDIDFLIAERVIAEDDRSLFAFADSAQEAWDSILGWYTARGRPLPG